MQTFNKMKFFNRSPRQLLTTVVNCRSLLWPGSVCTRRRFCHSVGYHRSTSFSDRFAPDSCCWATSSPLLSSPLSSYQPVPCSTLQRQTRSHSQLSRHHRPSTKWTCLLIVILVLNAELVGACGPGRSNGRRHAPRTKLIPLVFKQHVPNVSENTLGASGLNEGRITREHKRFRELVPNYNQDIIFKDDEGTGADRLMTQRMKEKLNMLSILVMNQWPGVKLRVIEGWDEDNKHVTNSLHYEGRAVDITTSDRDRSKYGMLARLAVDAGFDWVYYESRVHIHCSVKSEKSEAGRNGGCFDENSIVYGRNGPLRIDQLHIGDEILTVNSEGKFVYSKVFMFLDRDPDIERLYYDFKTESGSTISTTPSHVLFVSDNNSTESQTNMMRTEFARDIKVGQYLYSTHGKPDVVGGRATLERIVNIETRLGQGAFAPLTATGNLVVNNVTASCYAVIRSQSFAHLSFAPIRFAHNFVEFGNQLSKFLQIGSSTYQESHSLMRSTWQSEAHLGIHWYARLLYSTFKYFIPSSIIYH